MEKDAEVIIRKTIEDVMPDKAVKKMLHKLSLTGKIYVAAIGKACLLYTSWGPDTGQ